MLLFKVEKVIVLFSWLKYNIYALEKLMPTKIHYTSETLLNEKFEKNVKGYDAYQVDVTLDRVLEDYRFYENFYLEAKDYIAKLEKEIRKYKKNLQDQEVELAKLKNRFSGIKDNTKAGSDNLALLKRIDRLERELYARGVDPEKIK